MTMKLERLYAITIYLLNHGRTSAGKLAEHFEVSARTIQRDIDSLCLAGIPVTAVNGAAGGYEISERFRMDREFATAEEYACILTALQGLVSATDSPKAKHALEKIVRISEPADRSMILDFSVLREGDLALLQTLQEAVAQKRAVCFTYTNNDGVTRTHQVEPIAVLYRWYAWYLLAYSKIKDDYRTYKLVRMRDPRITDVPFVKEHAPADVILKRTEQTDSRKYIDILVRCEASARPRVTEYLSGIVTEELPGGDALMKLTVVENEQLWIGTLLSLGNRVEILAPEEIRSRILLDASKIISLYGKS